MVKKRKKSLYLLHNSHNDNKDYNSNNNAQIIDPWHVIKKIASNNGTGEFSGFSGAICRENRPARWRETTQRSYVWTAQKVTAG